MKRILRYGKSFALSKIQIQFGQRPFHIAIRRAISRAKAGLAVQQENAVTNGALSSSNPQGHGQKTLLCVQTHAQALAHPGRGRANGVLALLLLAVSISISLQAYPHSRQIIAADSITSLQIGDTIPEELWNTPLQVANHPEGKETITLGDYKGKLIILDFWATWCTACIKEFAQKTTLTNSLKHPAVILPITSEPADKIADFLTRQRAANNFDMISVVGNTALKRHFPHKFIPHYVVIHPDGQIAAYLAAQHVTEENLMALLNGDELEVPMKTNDTRANGEVALADLLSKSQTAESLYSSTITDAIADIGFATGNKIIGGSRRFYFYNAPVIRVLEFGFETRMNESSIGDLRKLPDTAINKPICYELSVPKDTPVEDARKMMVQDISRLLHARLSLVNGKVTVNQD